MLCCSNPAPVPSRTSRTISILSTKVTRCLLGHGGILSLESFFLPVCSAIPNPSNVHVLLLGKTKPTSLNVQLMSRPLKLFPLRCSLFSRGQRLLSPWVCQAVMGCLGRGCSHSVDGQYVQPLGSSESMYGAVSPSAGACETDGSRISRVMLVRIIFTTSDFPFLIACHSEVCPSLSSTSTRAPRLMSNNSTTAVTPASAACDMAVRPALSMALMSAPPRSNASVMRD